MNSMEQKKWVDEQKYRLERKLSNHYERMTVHEKQCFRTSNGIIFSVVFFPKDRAFVLEYADNQSEAERNLFEDGDWFSLNEMDEETLFRKMVKEIESQS